MKSIAIVIPWFDSNLTGGAERQAFQLATRLASRGHRVDVLTTCNESFASDWSVNHHDEGETEHFDLTIRRFGVDQRDAASFDRVNAKLLALNAAELRPGVSPLSSHDAEVFAGENIKSSSLLNYLRTHHESYDPFIFLPYMFQTATSGALLVADRAWLQPCLHDEPAAYLPQTAEMFRRVRRILFNSNGEKELALELYGPGIIQRCEVVGEGIESVSDAKELPEDLSDKPFLLYLGRREAVKNLPLLLRAFSKFREEHPESVLQLVLAGPGPENISAPGVLDLGLVTDELKSALLRSALALVQPSLNESFSRVMMESWSVGRPIIVHSQCRPTAEAVHQSGGGWVAATEAEWSHSFHRIEQASRKELMRVGERGRSYSEQHANWDRVIDRYEKLLEAHTPSPSKSNRLHAVHQLLPDMVYGDAISKQALAIRDRLRQNGYQSDIFVKRREERMRDCALLFDEVQPGADAGLLYHHSIGSELTAAAVSHAGPKCLIYHNVTPAHYYAPYRPAFAWMLETGRASLKRLAPHFEVSVGDSAYNAHELTANGFSQPGVLPIVIDPNRWNIAPDETQLRRLLNGRRNLLFTGRIAPHKKQDRLVEAFSYFHKLDPGARLIIAGDGRPSDPYFHHVLETIKRLKLESVVEVTGSVAEETMLAYYRVSDLYWSFSEHEGFGAPLIEATWFDMPVFALGCSAVSETLDDAGELFNAGDDLPDVAERAFQLISDQGLRKSMIEKQRVRRESFTPTAVWPILSELVEQLSATLLRTARA